MHRFKFLWISIGVLILISLGVYLVGNFYPSLFFYNPAYSKHTQLRGYVLTDEQIVQAGNLYLENEQFFPQQLSYGALNKHRKSFFVILAKNTSNKQVSGTLRCVAGLGNVEVSVIGLGPHMKQSDVWIIPVGTAIIGNGPSQPQVSVEWARLYAK